MAVNGFRPPSALLYPLQDLLVSHDRPGRLVRRRSARPTTSTPTATRSSSATPAARRRPITFNDGEPLDTQADVPTCPFIFTGQRFDAETGLYYYKRRYYSPVLGRFLSRDPIGFNGGINPFELVGGKPTLATDPRGLAAAIAPLDIVGVLGPTSVFLEGSFAWEQEQCSRHAGYEKQMKLHQFNNARREDRPGEFSLIRPNNATDPSGTEPRSNDARREDRPGEFSLIRPNNATDPSGIEAQSDNARRQDRPGEFSYLGRSSAQPTGGMYGPAGFDYYGLCSPPGQPHRFEPYLRSSLSNRGPTWSPAKHLYQGPRTCSHR